MTDTARDLLDRLTAAGLVPETLADELRMEAELGEPGPFLDGLVHRGVITPYQRHAVLGGTSPLVLGEYVLLDRLGKGGMGVVYKARHRRMHRLAAIKVLAGDLVDTDEGVQRFYREIRAIARLNHPNIAHAYDASETDGLHYLVMELVDGQDLAARVSERGPMSLGEALDAVRQGALALACAHEAGIIHRDVKPANLLRSPDGRVKLLDLGIARLREPGAVRSETLTQTGWLLGSVPYMAPEHAEDPRSADHRSDIFSLGCTLHVLLTGRLPFDGTTTVKQILAAREQPTPDLREILPRPARGAALLDEVQALFARMVAKRPSDRVSTMEEIADDVASILARAPPALLELTASLEPADPAPLPGAFPPASAPTPLPAPSSGRDAGVPTPRPAPPPGDPTRQAPRASRGTAGPSSPGRTRVSPANPRSASARPAAPPPGSSPLPWIALGAAIVGVVALGSWMLASRGDDEPDTGSVAAAASSPDLGATAATLGATAPAPPAGTGTTTPSAPEAAAPETPAPQAAAPASAPPRPASARPPRPQTETMTSLLAAIKSRDLSGFKRTPHGLEAKGGDIATATLPFQVTPGYALAVTFRQVPAEAGALNAAFRVQLPQGDAVRVVEMDRVLGERVVSQVWAAASEPEAASVLAESEGAAIPPGELHSLEIEVHPAALIVRVDDEIVLEQGRPGRGPGDGPPPSERREGELVLATSMPTVIEDVKQAPLSPPQGDRPPRR